MIVIADSNIFFSALLTPKGVIAQILTSKSKIQFLVPDYLIEEIEEHLQRIADYVNKSKTEIKQNLKQLMVKITIVPTEEIPMKYRQKAVEIVSDIDKDDAPFLALHFYKKHKIWTGDRTLIDGLTAKGYDIFVTTTQLQDKLYKR
ncbi:MAG: PIN domain-containing protein [Flavobacteriaceae bacterium]